MDVDTTVRAPVDDAERCVRRWQRRQGSVYMLPPVLTDVPRLMLRAVPSAHDLPALDSTFALTSASDSDALSAAPALRRSIARMRSSSPPLVLAVDAPALEHARVGLYFSPDTAVASVPASYFSPNTAAPLLTTSCFSPAASRSPSPSLFAADGGLGLDVLPTTTLLPRSSPPLLPAAAARRKMAKLARTLGKPTPVQLVFGGPAPPRCAATHCPRCALAPYGAVGRPAYAQHSAQLSRLPVRARADACAAGRHHRPRLGHA